VAKAVLVTATGLAFAATAASTPGSKQAPSCHGVTDNVLCMPLPRGWSHSVGFGVAGGRPAAWMFAGNYFFPRFSGEHEAGPSAPPARKALITIGDFPLGIWGRQWHWRRVDRLRLPDTEGRKIAWRVRFAGRALFLSVHFGSKPDADMRRLVNARLRSVRS
jgi:hypothetical protein